MPVRWVHQKPPVTRREKATSRKGGVMDDGQSGSLTDPLEHVKVTLGGLLHPLR